MRKNANALAKKKVPIPLATNILRFQKYNFNFFATDEVIMFEYLTVKAISFRFKIFWHASSTIEDETGIKRCRLDTILDKFVQLKIATITVKGMPKVKHFKIHFNKIYSLRPKIYRLSKLSADERKQLADYFKSLAENCN